MAAPPPPPRHLVTVWNPSYAVNAMEQHLALLLDLAGRYGRFWVEFDAEAGAGIAAMERELRENIFGETARSGLEVTTRVFIATAEKLFREHRNDPAFDFGPS